MSTNWLLRDKTWLWQIIGDGCLVLLRVPCVQIWVSTLAGSLILDIDVPSTVAGVEVQLAPVAVQVSVRATNLLHPVLTGLDTPTSRPLGAGVNHTHLGWGTGEILTQIWRGSYSLHQTPYVKEHSKYLSLHRSEGEVTHSIKLLTWKNIRNTYKLTRIHNLTPIQKTRFKTVSDWCTSPNMREKSYLLTPL